MSRIDWSARIAFAPDDEGGTGAGGGAGDGGTGAGEGGAGGGGDGQRMHLSDPAGGAGEGAGGSAKWWEGKGLTDAQRTQITALGLTVDDPVQAVAKLADMEAAAKRKLGRPADQLIDRPGEGKDVGEWLREHGEIFGVPKEAAGYEIAKPEGWPKDAKWNGDLEAKARELGHKHGLTGAALNDFVGLYAGEVGRLVGEAGDELARDRAEMEAALRRDWGDQYQARVAQAQQAVGALKEKAGLTDEDISALAQELKPKIGSARLVRLFSAVGEMMGEDALVRGDGGGMGTTPAEARARLAEMRAPGGAYYEAVAKNEKATLKRLNAEIERLSKIAEG